MPFWAILLISPFTALIALVLAGLAGYGAYDYASRHWLALIVAVATWIGVSLAAAQVPDPGVDRPFGRTGAFMVGFAATLAIFIYASGAFATWDRTGHWEAGPGIFFSVLGGVLAAFVRGQTLRRHSSV